MTEEIEDYEWPIAGMGELVAALQCPICKEELKCSLLLPTCSHTFCSLCIRRALEYQEQCPKCKAPATAAQLVPNRLADEIASSIAAVQRSFVAFLTSKQVECNELRQRLARPGTPPVVPGTPPSSSALPRASAKRKRAREHSQDSTPPAQLQAPRTVATGGAVDRPRRGTTGARGREIEIIADDSSQPSPEQQDRRNPDGKKHVSCPVCGELVAVQAINEHLDRDCLKPRLAKPKPGLKLASPLRGRPSMHSQAQIPAAVPSVTASGGIAASTRTRVRNPVFSVMKTRDIQNLLKTRGLSLKGERNALIKRWKEFVLRFNSNLDSPNPLSEQAVVAALNRDEELRERGLEPTSAALRVTGQPKRTEKEQFAALKAELQQRMAKRPRHEQLEEEKTASEAQQEEASSAIDNVDTEPEVRALEDTPLLPDDNTKGPIDVTEDVEQDHGRLSEGTVIMEPVGISTPAEISGETGACSAASQDELFQSVEPAVAELSAPVVEDQPALAAE
eukprot:TRINITY_DN13868_c0_g1_i1.p1 TRINITY_DN13868_c0_g1~~TRINITY_DN13868_c0_g1_i1.p1  ORF type:complete len:507 (-),score=76.80 TRINITY_DN13868_c0_g1_i1:3-1523(-)